MLAVGIGTAALVIALSVFNGLEDLLRSLHGAFDPELKVSIDLGKSFEVTPDFLNRIRSIDGVKYVTEVIEDNVYVRYRNSDLVLLCPVSKVTWVCLTFWIVFSRPGFSHPYPKNKPN